MNVRESKEVAEEYVSSLADLTNNSKPMITMLTILAEESSDHAPVIVQAVEAHLQKVRGECKLPVLYLIDSILKNVKGDYLKLFSEHIVETFSSVFEEVDEATRGSMCKLRKTWSSVFAEHLLCKLDVEVNRIDPAWPILSASTGGNNSIHVNPKFFLMKEQVLEKERELIELRKVTTELLHAKTKETKPPVTAILSPAIKNADEKLWSSSQEAEITTTQFPAATASILNLVGISNRPEASARPTCRDPRLKVAAAMVPVDNTVLSEQLKQQLVLKQSVTSTINKPPTIADGSNISLLIANSNNNANLDIINKNFSGNANKDAFSHQNSQIKEPRSSINNNDNLPVNNSMSPQSQSVNSNSSPVSSVSSRGGGGSESKLKDAKSSSNRDSSVSESDKSSVSSKSSLRKLGMKSRSKQPHSSPSKIPKLDRDSTPVRSKSQEKENNSSLLSSRTSPQSSSYSSKNRKKSTKSRKRSPSPYRNPRRNDLKFGNICSSSSGGLIEEEQSGSLIVSAPHPPTFKEIRPATRQRNYIRRNKEGSLSPELSATSTSSNQALSKLLLESSSKDEDLRASLAVPVASAPSSISQTKDLDLRVLPSVNTNKRRSPEHEEDTSVKKSKIEKLDPLFGDEDVDLRTLTNPNAGRPPTPPPPVISGDEGKDSSVKQKTSSKSNGRDRSEKSPSEEKRDRDRSRDSFGRSRRRTLSSDDEDLRLSRRDRETDKRERNVEILKQAAEQLSQGAMTKADYNKLIQDVFPMNDAQNKSSHRQEKKVGSSVWEKGSTMDMKIGISAYPMKNGERHRKDYPVGRNEACSRWQNQQWQRPGPWAHPPGPAFGGPQSSFNPDYRPINPWQNPRPFGPMRPDFAFHNGFNPNINPRMGPGMMNGPNGSMMHNMMSNGPLGPMGMGHESMMMNGPMGNMMHPKIEPGRPPMRKSPPTSTIKFERDGSPEDFNGGSMKNKAMRRVLIDNEWRDIRYYGETTIAFLSWDDPREIGFQDGIRRVLIDGIDTITCAFNEPFKEFIYMGEIHRIKFGGPTRELYIDDCWYECYFGGPAVSINLGSKKVSVKLEGPSPQVKIGIVKRTDLVVGKIDLIIDAKNTVPVFLDAKPQVFEIEGTPHALEFIDALKTVLINGRPLTVEFGGLPKPIIVKDKKHFIRFSVLPKGIQAGYVRIAGMRGESPRNSPPISPGLQQIMKVENLPALSSMSPTMQRNSPPQDGTSFISTSPKPDLQLDMLKVENSPASTSVLNLNMTELYQRLVETGIVANLSETMKQEEPEVLKSKIIPVSVTDLKSLRVSQPAAIELLYSGKQCSSCGLRFTSADMSTKYSQHLDWHFRQNRKEKSSAKKAHSRNLYYSLSDWIQYEEVEDEEDRAQSWFETEKQATEIENAEAKNLPVNTEQLSVPLKGSTTKVKCHVCHDEFNEYYNEELEEWHIKPAVVFEDKYFHPLCVDDHKRAMERSAEVLLEALEMSAEGKDLLDKTMDTTIEEEAVEKIEEVKVEATQAKIEVKEVKDEDKTEKLEEMETVSQENESVAEAEPDIIVTEPPPAPIIEPIDLEAEEDEPSIIAENHQPTIKEKESVDEMEKIDFDNIKIKEEPLDEAEIAEAKERAFTNAKVKEEPIEPEAEPEKAVEERIVPMEVDTTYVAMKSSIDGNLELESTSVKVPIAPSKIKINISTFFSKTNKQEEQKRNLDIEKSEVEDSRPLSPAFVKPLLKSRNIKVYPKVEKGEEMSGLCSIM